MGIPVLWTVGFFGVVLCSSVNGLIVSQGFVSLREGRPWVVVQVWLRALASQTLRQSCTQAEADQSLQVCLGG